MLSVSVKEFSFHLFVKVYCYPVGTRKFHGISVDHKRFGILAYFNGRQLITSIYTSKASFSERIFCKNLELTERCSSLVAPIFDYITVAINFNDFVVFCISQHVDSSCERTFETKSILNVPSSFRSKLSPISNGVKSATMIVYPSE